MGVRGIRHLLRDVGWLEAEEDDGGQSLWSPYVERDSRSLLSSCGCKHFIWREWNASDAFMATKSGSPPLERIPSNSRFLIDGNGLAFYLHHIAYSRHLQSLCTKGQNPGKPTNCPTTKAVMTDLQTTVQALPCMLPLHLIRAATKEFVSGLKGNVSEVKVFWDGPARRAKVKTDHKRKAELDQQESYLELFCNHGTMISASKKKRRKYVCEWKQDFPFSKLFPTCVRHALLEEGGDFIETVECHEEADVELAKHASGDDRAYVVAFDSDFYFFKNIQYIPLGKLAIEPSGIHACVARRSALANLLGFENDDRLVEMALLMGNDYVDPRESLNVPDSVDITNVQSMVYYLQCHEDYQVSAKNKEGAEALSFVRSLYNLHSLEAFPLVFNSTNIEKHDGIIARDANEAQLLPEDFYVRDGIIRCLRKTLDLVDGADAKFPLSEYAVQAFEMSSMPMERHTIPTLQTRPTYQEIKAANFIERCIARFYRRTMNSSFLVRTTPPDALMSRLHFHAALASLRPTPIETDAMKEEKSAIENESEAVLIEEPLRLPIDEHESAILENIRNHRVTIIHGETGCGKSSRVPVMLLKAPPPDGSLQKVKFFISQPRRIAAKALVERVRSCEPEFKNKFALRMGHGWKEYESKETQAYFVTTGYLVRLLANNPERFEDCTHLVIDEVHERSVDTDILCLLCRRLLETNENIRLVLMSATLATKMYREYFDVPNEPIHVGVRRYPITEYFVEDLAQFGLPNQEAKAALAIQQENEKKRCITAPTSAEMKNRFGLAARLATLVGIPGSSVLIFVPGMAEIIAISECIEGFHTPGVRYTCFPIHGDIPFEDQMEAFHAPAKDEVKIIIATNAAESSVTLPNVDHVICLGLCRQIIYNQASHRQMLTPAWISQASAKQRAGRTGRVRPGNVYRLYTRRAHNNYFDEFEPGEMVRIPLDSVILMLKQILHEEVVPVFMDCLEPPPLDTIDRSFQSLYHWNFITEPDDEADITSLGSFVSALGVDLSLGSFIGLGIQFGVAAEAIEMAAMMSLPKTPYQITSPMWLAPGKFNQNASQTFSAKCKFDCGLYSEPMGLMNALWDYEGVVGSSKKNSWCHNNHLALKRWQQALSSRNSLRKRVADFLGISEERLRIQLPPRDMPEGKILILRVLKVWVFSDSIVECAPSKLQLTHDGSVALSIKGKSGVRLKEANLDRILQPEKHPFRIVEHNELQQSGVFQEEGSFHFPSFVLGFEYRILSYASEMNVEIILCYSSEELYLYIEKGNSCEKETRKLLESLPEGYEQWNLFAFDFTNVKRRGIQERACGLWTVLDNPRTDDSFARRKEFIRIKLTKKKIGNYFGEACAYIIPEVFGCKLNSKMIWYFLEQHSMKKKKASTTQPFWVNIIGECREISKQNLEDLLARKNIRSSTSKKNSAQSIIVKRPTNTRATSSSEIARPLFLDVPEGARILALLASSQRQKKHTLRIPCDDTNLDSEETYDFAMSSEEIDVSKRWNRLDSSNQVYVDDSVPSTAIHTTNRLYAVAANALELQRGGMRVDGLTLLPPNPLFLVMSLLSFGLEINTPLRWAIQNDESAARKKIQKSYAWLIDRAITVFKNKSSGGDRVVLSVAPLTDGESSQELIWEEQQLKDRLQDAIAFNERSMSMGEKLVCSPERIKELCEVFNGFDGYSVSTWEFMTEESITMENLFDWRKERKYATNEGQKGQFRRLSKETNANCIASKDSKKVDSSNKKKIPPNDSKKSIPSKISASREKAAGEKKLQHGGTSYYGDQQLITSSNSWFSTTLNSGEAMPAFPSTNILALLFKLFEAQVFAGDTVNHSEKFTVALNIENWDIADFKGKGGKALYRAYFVNDNIPTLDVFGRGKNKLPKWIKKSRNRPSTIEDAKQCVPPGVACPVPLESESDGLLFESLEDALKMEAAFWLNKQFCHAGKTSTRHWYTHSLEQMIDILRNNNNQC